MKTSREIMEIGIEESREEEEAMQYSEFFSKKWCSEEELKNIISELTLTNYRGNPKGYINAQFLKERLFGNNGSDSNSSSDESDSFNKGYEVRNNEYR